MERKHIMNNELINQMSVDDIDKLGSPNKVITIKPYTAIVVCTIVSIPMIISKLWVLGIFILALALLCLWKIPNEKRVAFYDEFLIIYPPNRKDVCQKIDYDEVLEWRVAQGKAGADSFMLRLTGDRYVATDCFNTTKIYKEMDKVLPEKEANYIRKKNIENTPLNFNFFKRKKK